MSWNYAFDQNSVVITLANPSDASRPYERIIPTSVAGFGILRPFRRDGKGDFAAGGGEENLNSCIGQVLGTRCTSPNGKFPGELPWRPGFGSMLELLRHMPFDETRKKLGEVYVRQALARWEPRVKPETITVQQSVGAGTGTGGARPNAFAITLRYSPIRVNRQGNAATATARVSGVLGWWGHGDNTVHRLHRQRLFEHSCSVVFVDSNCVP